MRCVPSGAGGFGGRESNAVRNKLIKVIYLGILSLRVSKLGFSDGAGGIVHGVTPRASDSSALPPRGASPANRAREGIRGHTASARLDVLGTRTKGEQLGGKDCV